MTTNNAWNVATGTTGQLLVATTGSAGAYASSAVADFSFTSSTAGATRTLTVSNTDNTNTSSKALLQTTTGGSSSGDPFHTYTITGATSFSQGLDNSDSDAYVLAASTALGTTNVMRVQTTGEINYPLQTAFLAYLNATQLNKTGNATSYTLGTNALTEVFDQNNDFNTNGTFTAPVTGRYALFSNVYVTGCTIATFGYISFISSNRTYATFQSRPASANDFGVANSVFADMDAADTCTVVMYTAGETGVTDDILGDATNAYTMFGGYLAC